MKASSLIFSLFVISSLITACGDEYLFDYSEYQRHKKNNFKSEGSGQEEEVQTTTNQQLVVTPTAWRHSSITTKSYSLEDTTAVDWKVGDLISVLDSSSAYVYEFTVVDTIGIAAVIEPRIDTIFTVAIDTVYTESGVTYKERVDTTIEDNTPKLETGKTYRIVYPALMHESFDGCGGLGFGGYLAARSTDYFYSDFFIYDENTSRHNIELKRLNSIIGLSVLSPADGKLEYAILTSNNQEFCVKGTFHFLDRVPWPDSEAISYESEFSFMTAYHSKGVFAEKEELVENEYFIIRSTIYPLDFSKSKFKLEMGLEDDSRIFAEVKGVYMEAGNHYNFIVDNPEYIAPPAIELYDPSFIVTRADSVRRKYDFELSLKSEIDTAAIEYYDYVLIDGEEYLNINKEYGWSTRHYIKSLLFDGHGNYGLDNVFGNIYYRDIKPVNIERRRENNSFNEPCVFSINNLKFDKEYSVLVYVVAKPKSDKLGTVFTEPVLISFKYPTLI